MGLNTTQLAIIHLISKALTQEQVNALRQGGTEIDMDLDAPHIHALKEAMGNAFEEVTGREYGAAMSQSDEVLMDQVFESIQFAVRLPQIDQYRKDQIAQTLQDALLANQAEAAPVVEVDSPGM